MLRYRIPVLALALAILLGALAFSHVPPARAAGTWNYVGLEGFSPGDINYPVIALDGTTPYIAFRDSANGNKLTVMKYNAGSDSWDYVGGSPGISAGTATDFSLAIYGGVPYVSYRDGSASGKATVKKFSGGSWSNVGATTGFTTRAVAVTTLAFDNTGTPYLSFQDTATRAYANVMKFDGANWVSVGPANFSRSDAYTLSMAIYGTTPYVVFQDNWDYGYLSVMKYDGANWVNVGPTEFSPGYVDFPMLGFDNSGTPYVGFVDYSFSPGKATVMKYNSGSNIWDFVGAQGFSAGRADGTSFTVYNNAPYISYTDYANSQKATLMRFDGTSWSVVGSAGFSDNQSLYTTLAFGSNGAPYVGFRDSMPGPAYKASVMARPPDSVTVTNSNDAGAGSLRQAISDVGSGGTITFDNDYTITLASTLTLGKDVTIDGSGHTVTLDGANQYRVLNINSGKIVTLNKLTITNGKAPGTLGTQGGGIENDGTLTFTNSTLSYNSAEMGGGIYNFGTLTVQSSAITHNTATYNSSGSDISQGGGIFNAGTVTIRNSTLSNNDATFTALNGIPVNGGGALYNSGPNGAFDVSNSTFYANSGTGILNEHLITLTNTTVVNSQLWNTGTLNLKNSLIDSCRSLSTIAVSSHNLVGDAVVGSLNSCLPTLVGEIDLQPPPDFLTGYTGTDTFGNHGGATATVSLKNDSPAIDAGDAAVCADANGINRLDQRGEVRSDIRCDIGAYEVQSNEFATVSKEFIPDGSWMTFGPMLGGVKIPAGDPGPYNFTLTRNDAALINPPPPPGALPFSLDIAFNDRQTGSPTQVYVMLCYDPAIITLPAGKVPRLYHYNGTSWDNLGGTLDKTSYLPYYCVSATVPVNSFSPFVITAEDAPTAVTLSVFNARFNAAKQMVRMGWETGTELNVVGFNVWRKTGDGKWIKLNNDLIVAKHLGEMIGDKYSRRDAKTKLNRTYYYKVELVHAEGSSEWSAEVKVKTNPNAKTKNKNK